MALKHIGKIRDTQEKVVILFNEVPNDVDYCLLVKTGSLNSNDHDEIMKALESNEGQSTHTFGNVIYARMNADGRPLLQSLHNSGKVLKVPTENVLLTPNVHTEVVLKEVNDIVRGQARSHGMADPDTSADAQVASQIVNKSSGALTDEDLAKNLRQQAETMDAQAKSLQEEANSLREQAEELNPTAKPKRKYTKKSDQEELSA